MTDEQIKPGWQPIQDVNWDAYCDAIAKAKNKQQILLHLQNLIESKGYGNMIRAARVAFNRLLETNPGDKGSIGVYTDIDGKEVYTNFRFVSPADKAKDEFNY